MKYQLAYLCTLALSLHSSYSQENSCPSKSDVCVINGVAYTISQGNTPPCWKKTGSGWVCGYKTNGACDTTIGEVPVDTCFVKTPNCPAITETCKIWNFNYPVNSEGTPPCWSKPNGEWQCDYKTDGKCDSSKGQIAIDICYKSIPDCPDKTATCDNDGFKYTFGFENTPPCWRKLAGIFLCSKKTDGQCNSAAGQLDTTTC